MSRKHARILVAGLIALCGLVPRQHAAARVPAAVAPPIHIVAAVALDTHGHVQARFHPGDRVELRIRWLARTVRPGTKIVILWSVHHGRQTVYRHYRVVPAQAGRWRITAQARITSTAAPGVYTFEGKVVVDHKATYRIFTLRVVR